MSRTENRNYMFQLVAEWLSSNETVTTFCKSHSLRAYNFYYWRKIYDQNRSQSTSENSFISLKVSSTPKEEINSTSIISLSYPNGVKLTIPTGTDISLVRDLVTLY